MNTSTELNQVLALNAPHLNNQHITMSSREIAQVTGKEHYIVLRDIRKMIAELERSPELNTNLYFNVETVKTGKAGRPEQVYHLNEELTLCLTTGYYSAQRMLVIQRMKELQRLHESPYQQLQELSVEMKVSERLGQVGSQLMNGRRKEKRQLKEKEKDLMISVQLSLEFDK